MNSSRHERILLVLLAYVIGFTTAFIAYALPGSMHVSQTNYKQQVVVQTNNTDTATKQQQTSIYLDETGLYVSTPRSTQLLSVNQASPLMASVVLSAATSGIHYALTDAELSRDKDFVYFCEQLTNTIPTCDPYVFDVQTEILHPVTIDDDAYASSVEGHTSAWSASGQLMLDEYISISANAPWALTTQE